MSAEELWKEFCEKKKIDANTHYEAWAFCGGGPIGDELADLVLQRKKFGTASAYDEYAMDDALDEIPKPGDYSVLLKDDGSAVCVIRDYEVDYRPFGEVSPFHAYSEGEGDRTLAYWKYVHTEFFEPYLQEGGYELTEDSLIVCEKFSVEYVPGEDSADELLFVEPSLTYAEEIMAYRQEMLEAGSAFDGCFSLKRDEDVESFVSRCRGWSDPRRALDENGARGQVLLCIRNSDQKMVGCVQAHYVLNDLMKNYTGHVGYSVRPSERRKGYAAKMLKKARDFLSTFGFSEIYLSCLPENEASRRTILKNGGEYVETVHIPTDDVDLARYRIRLGEELLPCDLHCHSTFSDGSCTPEEVVEQACAAGLSAVALTDHNTVEGLESFFRAAEGKIEAVGGCEFTTEADGQELHLLGLFLDPSNMTEIREAIALQFERKEKSNRDVIEKLREAGYPVTYEEFLSHYGQGVKNRVHIARYLMEKGIAMSIKEAFSGLLSEENGFYMPVGKPDFYEMIRLIRKAKGVPVWAHPLFHVDRETCVEIAKRAKACGLDGMEVYYSTYTAEDTAFMKALCEELGLFKSGGSDFHGENKPGLMIGSGYGNLSVPYSCYEALKGLFGSRITGDN